MSLTQIWKGVGWLRKTLIVVIVLYGIYGLAGYFVASPLLRGELVKQLSQQTGQPVELDALRFNPFANTLSLTGFRMLDEQGQTLFGFESFYVDFELSSLFRWSWFFDQIVLTSPEVNLRQHAPGEFNFSFLLNRESPDAATEDAPQDASPFTIPPVSIGQLTLEAGRFAFEDQAREVPDTLTVSPVSFSLSNFSTRRQGEGRNAYHFILTSPAGGQLEWQGQLALSPLRTAGSLGISGVALPPLADFMAHRLRFSVPSGEMSVSTHYEYAESAQGESPRLQLSQGIVQLRELLIVPNDQDRPAVALPSLDVAGIRLSLSERSLVLDNLVLDKPMVRAVMQPQGLDLASLFLPVEPEQGDTLDAPDADESASDTQATSSDTSAATEAGQGDTGAQAWQVVLNNARVQAGRVDYTGSRLASRGEQAGTPLVLAPLEIALKNVMLGPDTQPMSLALSTAFEGAGQLQVNGTGRLNPLQLSATITSDNVPLTRFEPWLNEAVNIRMRNGLLANQLQLELEQPAEQPVSVRANGSARIYQLQLYEPDSQPLLALNDLHINDFTVDTSTQDVAIDNVTLSGVFVRNRVDAQGRTVGDRISRPVSPSTAAASPAAPAGSPWRVRLQKMRLDNTNLEYADLSLPDDFSAGLYGLSGDIHDLDSRARPASLVLQGRVDGYAPFSVNGVVNPLAASPLVDLDVFLQALEMTSLTPYTATFLGYKVEKGVLGVKSKVAVQDNMLKSSSDISARQFFLGEKVESEDAVKAPIKLGLSVLRDAGGDIALPLKVEGDLSDPGFSVRGVVLKAIMNVLAKAATSPFSVLGGLVGAQDLERVRFPQGSAVVDGTVQQELTLLADVMKRRPALKIGLQGVFHKSDRLAYARNVLGEQLAEEVGLQWQQDLAPLLHSERFQRALQKKYRALLDEPYSALMERMAEEGVITLETGEPAVVQQQETVLAPIAFDAMAEAYPAEQAEWVALAQARTEAVFKALTQKHNIAPERLVMLPPATAPAGFAGVQLVLRD